MDTTTTTTDYDVYDAPPAYAAAPRHQHAPLEGTHSRRQTQSAALQLVHQLCTVHARRRLYLHMSPDTLRRRRARDDEDGTFVVPLYRCTVTVDPYAMPPAQHCGLAQLADSVAGKTLRVTGPGHVPLLYRPPELLLFGDQHTDAAHRDAWPSYTARSDLWALGMVLLTLAHPHGRSPLLVARRNATECDWRLQAPPAFIEAFLEAMTTHERLRTLVCPTHAGINWRRAGVDAAQYVWNLVEMLGFPRAPRDSDFAAILRHSSVFALLQRFRTHFYYAHTLDEKGDVARGWLFGGTYRGGAVLDDADVLGLQRNMRGLRHILINMLAWDQWRGRNRSDLVLGQLVGPLSDKPFIRARVQRTPRYRGMPRPPPLDGSRLWSSVVKQSASAVVPATAV